MLEIKNISKVYKTGSFVQNALDCVSISFRRNEFVSILGPSGSGKTTLLNILGGLDKYTSGDLIIDGISTKKYKDKDWDSYRNHRIGFVFQSYNLISHQTVLSNVELALTLSGVSKRDRRKRAIKALKEVGLIDHINKKPNQMSGGQMQRVAIARALINDPDIVLADEPTGALDSNTSIQIMELLKKISKNKLVIMVTHNPELAKNYSSRIISLKDGKITDDTNPYDESEALPYKKSKSKKTRMSFLTALKLSFNNIKTKKGRTILTSFASSIGIIGIALILSLSNGFDLQVKKYEKGIMSAMPIIISEQSMNMDSETVSKLKGEDLKKFPDYKYVIPSENQIETLTRKNKITKEYIEYIENMPKEYSYGVAYNRYIKLNFIQKADSNIEFIDTSGMSIASMPKSFDSSNQNLVMKSYYDILSGRFPENKNEIILIVDANNRVSRDILNLLNIQIKDKIDFDDIIGSTVRIALNRDLYINDNGIFKMNSDFNSVYDNSIELKVVGIVRMNEDFPSYIQTSSLVYTEQLVDYIISENKNSDIVKAQEKTDVNVLTGLGFSSDSETSISKENMLAYLGADAIPYMILLYPKDFNSKDDLLNYLDKYNENLSEDEKVIYVDQAQMISSMSGSIMSAITIVLIAFSSISLIVSSIMIGIITYISVLERTKEIGILRALGARKKDISRVFNAETFIIGIASGVIGILIALLLTIPVNKIIYNLTELSNVAKLNPIHALILILVSTTLTVIGGLIPAKLASKKDPVVALRTE